MRIGIIGAGFTGLSAALELVNHHDVSIFEAADQVGGLAVGFRQPGWEWTIEKFYHHIFTNDLAIISLACRLGIEPIFLRPVTATYWQDKIYQFDSAFSLFQFPGLNIIDKFRTGMVLAGFKLLPNGQFLERWTAAAGLRMLIGTGGYETVWESLLRGKFFADADEINLAWFWARVKKRTARLGTIPGGFQVLAEKMAKSVVASGGRIHLRQRETMGNLLPKFDAVLSTLPEPGGKVKYLDAHILLLEMDQPLMSNAYWLNILDRSFPFLVLDEHTNFVDPGYFGGSRLLYIGNYLPPDHSLFNLTATGVLDKYLPWLRRINPSFGAKHVIRAWVFRGPYAQPIVTRNYSRHIPPIKRGNKLFVANQSMIYPWDRGTNYAVELGQRAARIITGNC